MSTQAIRLCLAAIVAITPGLAPVVATAQEVQSRAPKKGLQSRAFTITLEVQEFSKDFAKWANGLTFNTPEVLTFRWGTNNPKAVSGRWQVNDQPFSVRTTPLGDRVLTSGPLPEPLAGGNPATFTIDFKQMINGLPPAAPKRYYVRAIPLNSSGEALGRSFPVVTITHAKPGPGTTFEFDTLKVVSVSKSAASIRGPSAAATSNSLNATNSIEITYSYDLTSENDAEVRQWLLTKAGTVAENNFWTWSPVEKGKGEVKNRATITCADPQNPTLIKAIRYRLTRKGAVLVERTKSIPGVIFTCPGYLRIKDLTPGSGNTIYGPKEGEHLNDTNSVMITYEYEYPSQKAADVRQRALRQNGTVDPFNFWTFSPVEEGTHTTTTRLSLRCKSTNQGPRTITGIKYGIYPKGGGDPLWEHVKIINLTFRCNTLDLKSTGAAKAARVIKN